MEADNVSTTVTRSFTNCYFRLRCLVFQLLRHVPVHVTQTLAKTEANA